MIARLHLALPFHIAVPEGREYTVYTYEDDGCSVSFFPPRRTNQPPRGQIPDSVKLDGEPAFIANGLRIEFRKESFNRTHGAGLDPPQTMIERAVHSFVTRLRYVTNSAQVRLPEFSEISWRIRYLDDDGNELPKQPNMSRGVFGHVLHFSCVGLTPTVWRNAHTLPPDFAAPTWSVLCLDAKAALPNVGTAVVLAATALEVFIAQILDQLADESDMPSAAWSWVNNRGNRLKDPSVEEQFDVLPSLMVGHSLKEDETLWSAFKNLKSARNSFVHEGLAKVGGQALSAAEAAKLVDRASQVFDWVRQWLPDQLHWPKFEPSTKFELLHELPFGGKAARKETDSDVKQTDVVE